MENVTMSRFKRLNVPDRFLSIFNIIHEVNIEDIKHYRLQLKKEYIQIEPVFNKNGYYLDRKTNKTWVEINGTAWIYSNSQFFKDQLEIYCGSNRLSNDKFSMLSGLIFSKIIDYQKHKDLYRMYLIQHTKRELRIY